MPDAVITYSKEALDAAYYTSVARRWAALSKPPAEPVALVAATEKAPKVAKTLEAAKDCVALEPLPAPQMPSLTQPIQLVLPDNMMVIPKASQTLEEMKLNVRRSRVVRIKSIIAYIVVMIVIILLANIIWQVVTHPEMRLTDWFNEIRSYFEK